MDFDIWYILLMIARQIPHVIMVGFNVHYVAKKGSVDGILMLIAGIAGVFMGIFHSVGVTYMFQHRDEYDVDVIMKFSSAISFVFSLLYMVGFILLMLKVSKRNDFQDSERIDLIEPGR
jgi:hypothetical protein